MEQVNYEAGHAFDTPIGQIVLLEKYQAHPDCPKFSVPDGVRPRAGLIALFDQINGTSYLDRYLKENPRPQPTGD